MSQEKHYVVSLTAEERELLYDALEDAIHCYQKGHPITQPIRNRMRLLQRRLDGLKEISLPEPSTN